MSRRILSDLEPFEAQYILVHDGNITPSCLQDRQIKDAYLVSYEGFEIEGGSYKEYIYTLERVKRPHEEKPYYQTVKYINRLGSLQWHVKRGDAHGTFHEARGEFMDALQYEKDATYRHNDVIFREDAHGRMIEDMYNGGRI